MNYFVVIEKGEAAQSFGAYVPDLPGCVATGSTREQVRTRIRSAIAMHLEGMREDGIRPSRPSMPEFYEVTELPAAASESFRVESITPHVKSLIAGATMHRAPTPVSHKKTAAIRKLADSDRNPNENCGRDLRQPHWPWLSERRLAIGGNATTFSDCRTTRVANTIVIAATSARLPRSRWRSLATAPRLSLPSLV